MILLNAKIYQNWHSLHHLNWLVVRAGAGGWGGLWSDVKSFDQSRAEFETKIREGFTITEKVPTRAFS